MSLRFGSGGIGVVALALVTTSGCVLGTDTSSLDLDLPDKAFTIDASRWNLDAPLATDYLATSCTSTPMCNAAAELACMDGSCGGSCSDASQRCQLDLDVNLYNAIDLVTERPELRAIQDQPALAIALDTVTFDVRSNTLDFATPELTVLVAPASITDPHDPGATPVGTVASIAAGASGTSGTLQLTDAGKIALTAAMSTYKTPFNVLLSAQVHLDASDPLPTGKLDAVIQIHAHAAL